MNKRNLNVITELILHKTDSKYPKHDIQSVDDWHKERQETVAPGWAIAPTGKYRYCGYHYLVKFDGLLQEGREMEWYGQHCSGHNWASIGCAFQGTAETEITGAQFETIQDLIMALKDRFPNLKRVRQHSDYDSRKPDCAGFTPSQLAYLNQLLNGI